MLDLARQASSLAFELANTLGDDLTVPQVETSATKTEETRALVSERVYLGTHPFGWSAAGSKGASIDEHAAAQMLRKFAIAGGQHLDGAAIYPGETVLGVAAAAASMLIYPVVNAANGFLITSKAHPRLGGLDPKGLRDQLMRTRASLGYVEHPLAEYYLHQPDSDEPLLDSLRAMDSFVKEGLIERVGMQNYHAAEVERAFMLCEQHGFTKPSVFQGFYNPLNRAVEAELLPLLAEHGARFFAQNPLAAELLNDATPHAGSPLAATPQHGVSGYEPFPRFYASANTEAVDRLSRACEAEGVTLLEASYRWLLVDSMLAKELNGGVVLSASSPELLDAGHSAQVFTHTHTAGSFQCCRHSSFFPCVTRPSFPFDPPPPPPHLSQNSQRAPLQQKRGRSHPPYLRPSKQRGASPSPWRFRTGGSTLLTCQTRLRGIRARRSSRTRRRMKCAARSSARPHADRDDRAIAPSPHAIARSPPPQPSTLAAMGSARTRRGGMRRGMEASNAGISLSPPV